MSAAFGHKCVREVVDGVAAGLCGALLWAVVAQAVFAFRNPHLTDTERFLRFGQALRFKKVLP